MSSSVDKVNIVNSSNTLGDAFPDITEWKMSEWGHKPPAPIEYVVDSTIVKGVTNLVVSMGGGGKTQQLLDLATKVSLNHSMPSDLKYWMGMRVERGGKVVIVTSEDSGDDIKRRLTALFPDKQWCNDNLIIVPLVSIKMAHKPFFARGRDAPVMTREWLSLVAQLTELNTDDQLEMVVFDPLQKMTSLDINADPAHAQFVASSFSELAVELNAAVVVTHHMNKTVGNADIKTVDDVRRSIRGSTALVDGARMVYAMWSADETKEMKVCKQMGVNHIVGSLMHGAVVKNNLLADRSIHTFIRNGDTGRLMDITDKFKKAIQLRKNSIPEDDIYRQVVGFLRDRSESGQYFTQNKLSGHSGKFKIGQKKFKNLLSDWEHNGQLRKMKVDGERYEVLFPPEAYVNPVDSKKVG